MGSLRHVRCEKNIVRMSLASAMILRSRMCVMSHRWQAMSLVGRRSAPDSAIIVSSCGPSSPLLSPWGHVKRGI